ncbi:SRPBCC domain-containing protein [Virgibacillus oceani]|uniref:ATPase n=1 Tax=Virgibacillus oceani TaxID=1479511 RepID=A0A917HNN3_9BACI|nr:SRPBCC domain-containing protein [Virgibacillus oceani]GGG84427.1 ATPase [Virgibacillus oceani]
MTENNTTSKVTSYAEGRDLIMERTFDAPRELVFKVFTEPEHLEQWWGPEGWQTTVKKFELKPDGIWHYCMRCEDKDQGDFYGQESWGKSVYHEIVEPEKIVYTDMFSDAEGNTNENMPGIKITMTFIEQSGKTKIVTRSEFPSEEDLKKIMEMGVVEGTASQYECLDDYLKEIQ